MKIAPYAKAITGAIVAGLAAARLALTDDIISKAESIDIAIATLTALALVWAIPNGKAEAQSVTGTIVSETGEQSAIEAVIDDAEPPMYPPIP